jgi:polysaccharide export outer membrane protein
LQFYRIVAALLALGLLSACALPRGAALQSEILAGADDEFPEIALYPVTRDLLPVVAGWPETGVSPSAGWIGHDNSVGSADIRIRPFDSISLVIWDSEPNSLLTGDSERLVSLPAIRVTEAGTIFVPYIGYLRVADRTPDQARRLVEREMAALVPSVQVQLEVTPGTRGSVDLIGGVSSPGTYPLPEAHFTVLDLVAMGGGPAGLRNPRVRLIRDGRSYLASYDTLLENPSRDTVLRGGDRVALLDDDRYFRALGAAGQEALIYFEDDDITALDALSQMGGVLDRRADLRGVLVLREYPPQAVRHDGSGPANTRAVFSIDMTSADGMFSAGQFRIFPGDTVLATESVITSAEAVVVLFGTVVGLSNRVAN